MMCQEVEKYIHMRNIFSTHGLKWTAADV